MLIVSLILAVLFLFFFGVKKLARYNYPKLFSFFIRRFAKRDRRNFPKPDSIVFTGSSIVQFWKTLENDLNPISVLNRGIAGTKISDIAYWSDRLVTIYKPKAVVLYAGSNDIQGNKPRTPQQVLEGFKTFVNNIRIETPALPIYFISITPSPAKTRWKNWALVKEANLLIANFCETDKNLYFIDTVDAFLGSDGHPISEYFKRDMIHFNAKGYSVWATILKPLLEKIN